MNHNFKEWSYNDLIERYEVFPMRITWWDSSTGRRRSKRVRNYAEAVDLITTSSEHCSEWNTDSATDVVLGEGMPQYCLLNNMTATLTRAPMRTMLDNPSYYNFALDLKDEKVLGSIILIDNVFVYVPDKAFSPLATAPRTYYERQFAVNVRQTPKQRKRALRLTRAKHLKAERVANFLRRTVARKGFSYSGVPIGWTDVREERFIGIAGRPFYKVADNGIILLPEGVTPGCKIKSRHF
jgi:hypothetical protein